MLRDKIQKDALDAWISANKVGSCEIITGLGKTFIALHALYTMAKDDSIHLFMAETTSRKKDLLEQIEKYNIIFNRDVLRDYNLQFTCYQSAYKWIDQSFGLIIADEIHDSLTPKYSKFYFYNEFKAIIGLSATINRKIEYTAADGSILTKGDILSIVAPVCYKYSIKQGQKDNTARKLNIYVIKHKLDNTKKIILSGSSKKRFYQTEEEYYRYWNSQYNKSWYIEDVNKRNIMTKISASRRSTLLYNLPSKLILVKQLIKFLTKKTILFSNSIDSLLEITPNVISSRNKEDVNEKIRNSFDNGKINLIGSFKKLMQGANLKDLDNCIMMSYYGVSKDFIQRIGRLRNNNTVGNIFIVLTENTQEQVWFNKMLEDKTDLNITYIDNLTNFMNTNDLQC